MPLLLVSIEAIIKSKVNIKVNVEAMTQYGLVNWGYVMKVLDLDQA